MPHMGKREGASKGVGGSMHMWVTQGAIVGDAGGDCGGVRGSHVRGMCHRVLQSPWY
jgi:hypothetical protein